MAAASATPRRPTENPEQARTQKENHPCETCKIQTHRELPEGRTGLKKSETLAELKASPSPCADLREDFSPGTLAETLAEARPRGRHACLQEDRNPKGRVPRVRK